MIVSTPITRRALLSGAVRLASRPASSSSSRLRHHHPAVRCFASSSSSAGAEAEAEAARALDAVKTKTLNYDKHEPANPVSDAETAPILFLHGLFGSRQNNRSMSKALARDLGRYVYTLDLRNHGDSPHDPRHDYIAMAADTAAFIKGLNLKKSTIIGHSMGAKTAMVLALAKPDLVDSLIAVDNAPVAAQLGTDFGKYINAMQKIRDQGMKRLADADKFLAQYEENPAIRAFLLTNFVRPSPGADYIFRVPLDVLLKNLPHMGDFPFQEPGRLRFEKPALFVRGTESSYVPDEAVPLVGQFFPRFELVDVPAGHWLISEKPEIFKRAVCEFLGPKE